LPDAQPASLVQAVLHAPAVHVANEPHDFGARGGPLATSVHLPSEPATSHARQVPSHAESQHLPSTQ
jgi:hypothetical protein